MITIFHEPINIRAENVARIKAEAEKHGIQLNTRVFDTPEAWQNYSLDSLRMVERIASELGIQEHLHLWPDSSLGSKAVVKRQPDPAKYQAWLDQKWKRISEWPTDQNPNPPAAPAAVGIVNVTPVQAVAVPASPPTQKDGGNGVNQMHQIITGNNPATSTPVTGAHEVNPTNITLPVGITARQLTEAQCPETPWIVEGLVPEGLTILSAKQKTGKTFMSLDVAIAVATGDKLWGRFTTSQGAVLMLALEDNRLRLQQRLLKRGGCNSDNLTFVTMNEGWLPMNAGGLQMLNERIKAHPGTKLVIIDTLQTVVNLGRGYAADCNALRELAHFATAHHLGILVIHHTRKQGAKDPFDLLIGSQGLGATADTLLVLERSRNQGLAVLHVTGRDVEEKQLAMRLQFPDGKWHYVANAEAVCKTTERQ